jgi:hypothetical protein
MKKKEQAPVTMSNSLTNDLNRIETLIKEFWNKNPGICINSDYKQEGFKYGTKIGFHIMSYLSKMKHQGNYSADIIFIGAETNDVKVIDENFQLRLKIPSSIAYGDTIKPIEEVFKNMGFETEVLGSTGYPANFRCYMNISWYHIRDNWSDGKYLSKGVNAGINEFLDSRMFLEEAKND